MRGEGAASTLVGDSLAPIRALIDRLAASRAPVFVAGEPGTGKDLVARALHERGPRAAGPFVPVNAVAVPQGLFESAFFGHVAGAFTGAAGPSLGYLRSAHGGTLFLDEIGELNPEAQAKLLRALQEPYTFWPVGAAKPATSDFRLVCATNRDLASLIDRGGFREDLAHRIQVHVVRLPPLAKRASDIPQLVPHLLKRMADHLGAPCPTVAPDVLPLLARQPWPGNVRQLETVLRRAFDLCDGGVITAALIREQLRETTRRRRRITLELLRETLRAARGRVPDVAREFGVTHGHIYRKCREHGVQPSDFVRSGD